MSGAAAGTRRVVIVGGGIIGTAAAHALLDGGAAVTIVDPGDEPGRASDGNAGWIAHMDVLPLASGKALRHLPRWLLDPTGPLALRPAHLPRALPWLWRFAVAMRPAAVEAASRAIAALNGVALPAWRRRLAATGLEGHLRERGILSVWGDAGAFAAAAPLVDRQRRLGLPVEALSADDLRRIEPAFGPAVAGGVLYPTGCHVGDPRALLGALRQDAEARGATVVSGRAVAVRAGPSPVVRLADGREIIADDVVIAAGAWSAPLAAALGDRVPLDTERVYNVTAAPGSTGLTRPVAFEGEDFVSTPLDCGDRIGGAVEFAGLHAAPDFRRVDAILARLRRLVPGIPDPLPGVRWMGFRPSLPDSLPVIGRSRASDRITYAFGHAHHGLTQAAITAELVADLVAGRAPRLDLAPFSAQRFGRGAPVASLSPSSVRAGEPDRTGRRPAAASRHQKRATP